METLVRLIKESKRIGVLAHIHPDGDAVSSLLALQLGLEQLGKEVFPILHDPVPDVFAFLPQGDQPIRQEFLQGLDLYLIADLNDLVRTGYIQEIQSRSNALLATIDHHPKGDLYKTSDAIYHDEQAASCTEMIYRLFIALEIKITPQIATCLLTGIYTDTGGFQYPNTTTETLEVAADLMRRGAKLNAITLHISHSKSVSSLKLMGIALSRLKITHNGQCAVSAITHEELLACSAGPEDIGGIIGEINGLSNVRCSLFIVELEPGILRGSIRSGEAFKTPVNLLAKLLGGGGHPRAAGFSIPGRLVIDKATNQWQVVS